MNRRRSVASWVIAGVTALTWVGCGTLNPAQRNASAPVEAKGDRRAVPTKTGAADVNGARFYYQIYGDLGSGKTPLLVLHGSFMSSEAMAPLIQGFVGKRPVIAFDARGHGRTGDLPGPISYGLMAADAAGVLDALKVPIADVLGYSMGGVTALAMAVRFPDKVGKQVIVSGVARVDGYYPEVVEGLTHSTVKDFEGGPLEAAYQRLSPTPEAFAALVDKLRAQEAANYDQSDEAIRAIANKTMIILGDSDCVQLDYALKLFRLRGGGDRKAAAQGFLPDSPRARLAILPATSHVGIMADGPVIAELATPFLDDTKPVLPPGFFK